MILVLAEAEKNTKNAADPGNDVVGLALLSGILLALCYAPVSWGFLGWIALVPLLLSLESANSRATALARGFACGFVFFLFSLHWVIHVDFLAWPSLVLPSSLFMMLFAWTVYEGRSIKNPLLKIFWPALAWMSCEILRSEIPVFGFGWNLLAFSQSRTLPVLQSANVFGAYGLGFVMALVNVCIRPRNDKRIRFLLLVIIFGGLFFYGNREMEKPETAKGKIQISVLQGNIPQSVKWATMARGTILETYLKLTELASFDRPGLIIWPEAAFPGYFNRDTESPRVQALIQKIGIPLLIGAPHLETDDIAFNSAYLMDGEGKIRERYDKKNLVPFGEYVPLKRIFGFLERFAYSLGVSDFSAGKTFTVFRLFDHEIAFSVLICFEDTFSRLARGFVDRGAQFLVVMTNDAWFERSAAPYQHLDASIFRAVENGVPVVRAANTGVSAFISPKGEVYARVRNKKGEDIFSLGKETAPVVLREGQTTPFRQGGWIFPYAGSALFGLLFLILKAKGN